MDNLKESTHNLSDFSKLHEQIIYWEAWQPEAPQQAKKQVDRDLIKFQGKYKLHYPKCNNPKNSSRAEAD